LVLLGLLVSIEVAVRTVAPVLLATETFALSGPGVEGRTQAATGPLRAALRVVGAEPLKAAVLHAAAPYRTSTGAVRLQNHFRFVTAMSHDDGRPTS
jgi:hypothetical protein